MEMLPNDVRQHRFRKSLRGYNTDEVDQFLEHLATTLEATLSGRHRAEELASALEKEMAKFRDQEDALKKAVFTVERAMTQAHEASQGEVEALKRTAEHRAKQVLHEAEAERRRLEQDLKFLKESRQSYIEHLKAFCRAQLQTLENLERPVRAKEAARQALMPKRPKASEPSQPAQSVQPTQPTQSTQPAQAPEPSKPAQPVQTKPDQPSDRIRPWQPDRATRPESMPPASSAPENVAKETAVAYPPPLVPDAPGDEK